MIIRIMGEGQNHVNRCLVDSLNRIDNRIVDHVQAAEGITDGIHLVGDVMTDVLMASWGAWRAVVDEVLDHFLVLIDVSAHCGDRIVAGVHLDLAEPARFAAVGWSS